MDEILLMIDWFSALPLQNRKDLSRACSWYSYHLDSYLNSIYRKKAFPINQLIKHADELIDPKNHSYWVNAETTFGNELCDNPEHYPDINISPFGELIGKKIRLSRYIKLIIDATTFIDRVFKENYYTLSSDITVYRGIYVLKTQDISFRIIGMTSCSTDIRKADYFAFSMYGMEEEHIDRSLYNFIIFEIKLPAGTRIIPMNICTLQDEDELAIISQGHLERISIKIDGYFTRYKTQFIKETDEPEYGSFRVSMEEAIVAEHVINDMDMKSKGKRCRKKNHTKYRKIYNTTRKRYK